MSVWREDMLVWKGNEDNFHKGAWRVFAFTDEFEDSAWSYAYGVLRSHGYADRCVALVELDEERMGRKRTEQSKADREAGKKKLRQCFASSGRIVGFKHYVFPATTLADAPERYFYEQGLPIEDSEPESPPAVGEAASENAKASGGTSEGALESAGEALKEPEAKPEGPSWDERPWRRKRSWLAAGDDSWESGSQRAATWPKQARRKDAWKAEAEGQEDDPMQIFAYMREKTESKDGGPSLKVELPEFEETILGKLGCLTEEQRKKFAERREWKGRGASSLWYAAWTNAARVVQALIEHRAKIDQADWSRGRTPLWEAASQGHLGIVQLLIEREADVNVQTFCGSTRGDKKGKTVLKMAEVRGRDDVVALLLEARADVEASRAGSSLGEGADQMTAGGASSKENPVEAGSAQNEMAAGDAEANQAREP
jgi:hypothetical protein